MARRILFIDDNSDDHLIVKLLAKRRSAVEVDIDCTSTVEDAVAVLRKKRFDLILIDHRLHPFKGFTETVPLLRKHMAGADMIVVSDFVEGIDPHALPDGVSGVIAKSDLPTAFADGRIA